VPKLSMDAMVKLIVDAAKEPEAKPATAADGATSDGAQPPGER
jgi:hypothetical protein